MTVDLFKEYDEKTIAYEWIVECPSNTYDFILELIHENEKLKAKNELLMESNSLAATLLGLKYKKN